MKILKYILIALLLLVLAFFALGFIKPAISYDHEVTVNKPIKEAWAVHADQSKLGEWLDGFKSIEHISGKENEVGSKYKVVVRPEDNPEDFIMTETITSKKDFEHMTLNFDSEVMVFDQKTSFSSEGNKTKIKKESTVKGKNAMMRSMFAMMHILGGSFKKQEIKHMTALKKLIESNTTDYFPAVEVIENVQEEVEE